MGDMVTAVDTDTADTVDTDTVDTMVLDTTAVDTDMAVTDMVDTVLDTVDTMDVNAGPLKVMPKPTMVDIMDMVDTVDMVDMVMADMATTDKCHLSSQIFMDQVTR